MDITDIMLKLDIKDLPNNIKIPKEAIDYAASLGRLFMFKALIDKGCYPRKVTGIFAVANGRLNIVRYLADMDYKFTDDHIKYARKGNHFDVLDFLLTFVREDSPDCLPKLRRFRGSFNAPEDEWNDYNSGSDSEDSVQNIRKLYKKYVYNSKERQ